MSGANEVDGISVDKNFPTKQRPGSLSILSGSSTPQGKMGSVEITFSPKSPF